MNPIFITILDRSLTQTIMRACITYSSKKHVLETPDICRLYPVAYFTYIPKFKSKFKFVSSNNIRRNILKPTETGPLFFWEQTSNIEKNCFHGSLPYLWRLLTELHLQALESWAHPSSRDPSFSSAFLISQGGVHVLVSQQW